jgi:hypothetical protein
MTSTNDYNDPQMTPNGKVSKAKKGKPVHVCPECQKVKGQPLRDMATAKGVRYILEPNISGNLLAYDMR